MRQLHSTVAAAIVLCSIVATAHAEDDLNLREEAAIKAAVSQIAPSVVRIETLGGLETVGKILVGTGPTTGLIVSDEGYIVSSAFNFVQQPSQIIVYLADGTRLPAEMVGRDHSRMLVLLKVPTDMLDSSRQLTVPLATPKNEMRVGAWAIAVGRVFEPEKVNVSVGIVSALGRVWGKAIQTDAKISPANYGGPLVDLRGRVLGVLVPMSPQESSEVAGVEWYDSGIGFAVPLADIKRVLDRLKKGEHLEPGLLGVNIRSGDPYTTAPVIAACRPKSPAAAAGLKPGDQIVEFDGVPIERYAQLRHQLAPRYAGENVSLVVLRGQERLTKDLTLIDKLQPYIHPFLGILPRRDGTQEDGEKKETKTGVIVRDVYSESPAAKAGVKAGDRLVTLNGKPIADRLSLQDQIAALEPRDEVKLEIERDSKAETLTAKLATLPEAVPDALPPAHESLPPKENGPPLGKLPIKIPEAKSDCWAYIPDSYRSAVPHGMIVWLQGSKEAKDDNLIAMWKLLCEQHDLILLIPNSEEAGRWQRSDLEFIRKMVDEVVRKYQVDPTRIIAAGTQGGGAMAYLLAGENRDLLRGVVAIDAPLPPAMATPLCEPTERLAIFSASARRSSPHIAAGIERLREAKHPVTELELDENSHVLNDDQRAKLARWVDTLDRS
ncbi:MAG: PDZ domain-containing protein [Pirellulales bacterium]|nr:PDZ domain-containing protein [Pirellulales bacterium]